MPSKIQAVALAQTCAELQQEILHKYTQAILEEMHEQLTARKPPDYTTLLAAITSEMQGHQDWGKLRHTPLENDLPVRAANAVAKLLHEKIKE